MLHLLSARRQQRIAHRIVCAALGCATSGVALAAGADAPPVAPVRVVTDTYFGRAVDDPYRWMEQLDSPDVQSYAKAEDAYARRRLDAIPGRAALFERIKALDASVEARIGTVVRLPGDRWFYEKRGADDNQFKIYSRAGLAGPEKLLIDPDALAREHGGDPYAVTFFAPSDSGRLLAYGLSTGGSEEASIHVLEVASGRELIEPIDRAHYSEAAWLPDDSGFLYLRQRALPKDAAETEKYRFQTAYLHRMNKPGPDVAIVTAGESTSIDIPAESFPYVFPFTSTVWSVAIPQNGVQNEQAVYVKRTVDLAKNTVAWRKLYDVDAAATGFAIHGDDLYVLTHKGAPRFQVLRTSVTHPDLAHAEVVVAPSREVVVGIRSAKDALYVVARDGTVGKLYRVAYGRGAQPALVKLPQQGAVSIATSDPRLPGAVVELGSWTRDVGFYALEPNGATRDTGLQAIGAFGAPDWLAATEVLVRAEDGVEVPLSIVAPKSLVKDGSNPTLLYGYGSYGITDDPFFGPRYTAWFEQGAVRATCHVRGGGAYGEEWHLAGKQATKPNTWKDFVACAEYLIREGYTSPAKLGIQGGSAGGILVGRTMTARPDLFAAAVPQVGVLNALRAETSANGVPNIPEFGTVKDEAQAAALYEMDALVHVVDGARYPATLITTGINDPRVPPWESLKFGARLQAATASGKPVLMRIDYAGGHGIGSTKLQRQEETTDVWSFLLWQFGQRGFQPAS